MQSKKLKKICSKCGKVLYPEVQFSGIYTFVDGTIITSLLPFQFFVVLLFCYAIPGRFSNNWHVCALSRNNGSVTSV